VEVNEARFGTAELASFCEELVQVMRDANGAGIAAPQVGVADRIFVVHGTGTNPRCKYTIDSTLLRRQLKTDRASLPPDQIPTSQKFR
jgi:peptide deformylase